MQNMLIESVIHWTGLFWLAKRLAFSGLLFGVSQSIEGWPASGFLHSGEASRRLSCSPETARSMLLRGEVEGRVGSDRIFLFDEASVDRKAAARAKMEAALRAQQDEREGLSVEQFARATAIHPSAIVCLWHAGKIPHCGLRGQRPIFDRKRVAEVLQRRDEHLAWLRRLFPELPTPSRVIGELGRE